jgi:hypothetical protein
MNQYEAPRVAPSTTTQAHGAEPRTKAKFNSNTLELLRSSGPWQMLIGVWCLLLTTGFFLLIPYTLYSASQNTQENAYYRAGQSLVAVVVYAIGSVIYIYPGLKLISSSRALRRLKQSRSADDLEAALTAQREFWRFAGIGLIVAVCLYALIGLVVLAVARK